MDTKQEMIEGAEKTKEQARLLSGFYKRKQFQELDENKQAHWESMQKQQDSLVQYNQELIDYLNE